MTIGWQYERSAEIRALHELPIAQGVLERVLHHAALSSAPRVTGIYMVIGDLSGVSAECIGFYWDAISRGTMAENAALHFRRVPMEITCLECSCRFAPTDAALEYDCPTCGSARTQLSHGQECYLEAIDIAQPDDAEAARDASPKARS